MYLLPKPTSNWSFIMNVFKFIAGTTLLTTSTLSVVSVVNETKPILEAEKPSVFMIQSEFVNEPLVSYKGEDKNHEEELNNRAGW